MALSPTYRHGMQASLTPAIIVVEDDDLLAKSILRLARGSGPIWHAHSVSDAFRILDSVQVIRLALIDVTLGADGSGGVRVLEGVQRHSPDAVCALMTGRLEQTLVFEAAENRALFLPKPFTSAAVEIIKRLLSDSDSMEGDDQLPSHRLPTHISANVRRWCEERGVYGRQRTILTLVLIGRPRKVIADELGISVNTVRSHLERIVAKSGYMRLESLRAKLLETSSQTVGSGEGLSTNAPSTPPGLQRYVRTRTD